MTADNLATEAEKGHRVRTFFEIEARTLQERYRVIETLLPNSKTRGASHRGEEGRFIESLLRNFLNKHLPANLQAVSGFILCPATKTGASNTDRVLKHQDRHSTQLDVIIYDFDAYPVYERYEEFCIVPPEGVIGIVSVKKTLYLRELSKELVALRNAALLCAESDRRTPCTALLAFSADQNDLALLNEQILRGLRTAYDGGDFDTLVNELAVMEQTCVFKVRSDHSPANEARYVAVDCREELHIPLQRLLQTIMSVYYDPTRGSARQRPGFVSFRQNTFKNAPNLGLLPYDRLSAVPSDSQG